MDVCITHKDALEIYGNTRKGLTVKPTLNDFQIAILEKVFNGQEFQDENQLDQ